MDQLQSDKLWWNWPDWLLKSTDEWPVCNFNKESESFLSETEVKKSKAMYEAKLVAADGSVRQHGEQEMSQSRDECPQRNWSSIRQI